MKMYYKPRKTKIPPIESRMVRIDQHTVILVASNITDDEARKNYFAKMEEMNTKMFGYRKGGRTPKKEEPVISPEDLEGIIDDGNLPEPD